MSAHPIKAFGLLKLIASLPLAALYAMSGFLYLLAFYGVRHRQAVIRQQLARVFPQKSAAQRRVIHKRFLRNFCDVSVEILKLAAISEAQMRARVTLKNIELAHRYLKSGQSILFVTSHLCNWEWLLQGVALHLGFPLDAAYKPVRDAWGESVMHRLRSRFGARLVPAKQLLPDILQHRGVIRAIAINADQAPSAEDAHTWTSFLGQDTAFYLGAEQIARATRLPMVYVVMRRLKQGFYEVQFQELWDGEERTEAGEITSRYARLCEADVWRSPADWLWSYRRWKLKKPLYESA